MPVSQFIIEDAIPYCASSRIQTWIMQTIHLAHAAQPSPEQRRVPCLSGFRDARTPFTIPVRCRRNLHIARSPSTWNSTWPITMPFCFVCRLTNNKAVFHCIRAPPTAAHTILICLVLSRFPPTVCVVGWTRSKYRLPSKNTR